MGPVFPGVSVPDPKELAGVYSSEGNNCSIDFAKAGNPVAEPDLSVPREGPAASPWCTC